MHIKLKTTHQTNCIILASCESNIGGATVGNVHPISKAANVQVPGYIFEQVTGAPFCYFLIHTSLSIAYVFNGVVIELKTLCMHALADII